MRNCHGLKPDNGALVGWFRPHASTCATLEQGEHIYECLIDSAAYIEFKDPLLIEAF